MGEFISANPDDDFVSTEYEEILRLRKYIDELHARFVRPTPAADVAELVERFERQVAIALHYATEEKPKHEKFIASVFELQVGHLRDIGREAADRLAAMSNRVGELTTERDAWKELSDWYHRTGNEATEKIWGVLGREPHREGGENLVGRIKELIARAETAEAGKVLEPLEMRLCEANRIQLQPDRLYRFTVDPKCPMCRGHASQAFMAEAVLAAMADPETTDEFDMIDYLEGGDGKVYDV